MDDTPDRLDDDFTSETLRDDEPFDDTSGGSLSSGAGEGSGQDAGGAPDIDVPGRRRRGRLARVGVQ